MEITSSTASQTPTQTNKASSKVSADFDTFLKMLTAQIQNQDPMNPIDSADYAVQLATFSSVEQQTLTNQKLDALASLMGVQGMADLAPLVGQKARINAPAYMDGTPITLYPLPTAGADRAVLVVRDANGNVVAREDIKIGEEEYIWEGKDIAGGNLPKAVYSLSLESYQKDAKLTTTGIEYYTEIQEVQIGQMGPVFMINGGIAIAADQVSALRSKN